MHHRTAFRRPDQALLDDLATAALAASGARGATITWVEIGSSNVVALAGDVAVRIARDAAAARELQRTQALVDALDLPFAVPRSVGAPVERDGIVAVPTQRIRGQERPPGPVDPAALAVVVEAIHGHDLTTVREHLAPRRAFAGGADWYAIATERALPALPRDVQDPARRIVEDLARLEAEQPTEPVLDHGDLAGSNIVWAGERVTGVLDWDLAACDDGAEDLASLAGWHGWETVAAFAPAEDVRRARVFARTHRLQVVCFALARDRPASEVDRAVARVAEGIRAVQVS